MKIKKKNILLKSIICFIIIVILLTLYLVLFTNVFKTNNKTKAIANINKKVLPVISGVKNIEVINGDEIDLLQDIIAKDYDGNILNPLIVGNYDFNKDGNYNLKVTACDKFDHCKEEAFVLTVYTEGVITPKYIDGVLIINKSYPVPSDYVPEKLVYLNEKGSVVDYVKDAYLLLEETAKNEGLNIYSSTAYRSYSFQSVLYENYVKRDGKEEADKFSARPGYSEHHSGLAIDLNTVNDEFSDTKEAKWLSDNCYKYGFILRYPKGKENETGYKYESWHIRYVGKELAEKLYNNGDWITLEDYFNITSEYKD